MSSVKTVLCAPCECRNASVSALKYCTACREQLCKECAESHNAFKATRKHILLRSEDLEFQRLGHDLEVFQTCTEHSDKPTEFYCGDHQALLCINCLLKSDTHKHCRKVIDTETIGKSLLDSRFTDSVKKGYHQMIESAKNTVTSISKAKECTSNNIKSLKCQIENVRRNVMEAFDRQTDHIIHEISDDLVDNSNKSEKAFQSLEKLVKLASESETLFQEVVDKGSSQDVFRSVLSILGQCEEFQNELEQTKRKCSLLNVVVEKSNLVKLLETYQSPLLSCSIERKTIEASTLCSDKLTADFKKHLSTQTVRSIKMNTDTKHRDDKCQSDDAETDESKDEARENASVKAIKPVHECRNTSSVAEIERNLEESGLLRMQILTRKPNVENKEVDIELSYFHSFDVPATDNEIPWFSGIVCLPDERLIVSDYNNSRLVLVRSATDFKEKRIEYLPGSITLFQEFLVVCLKEKNLLYFLKVQENNLKDNMYLKTEYNPKCVKSVDEKRLVISSRSKKGNWYFELFTLHERKWQRKLLNIKLNGIHAGHVFAVHRVDLPENQDNFQIIHYAGELGRLQSFHQDGTPGTFQYEIEDAASLETDSDGNIFVIQHCGEVQVLTPQGNLITSIRRHHMRRLKFSAMNVTKDKLFITAFKDSRIHVIDVKRMTSDK